MFRFKELLEEYRNNRKFFFVFLLLLLTVSSILNYLFIYTIYQFLHEGFVATYMAGRPLFNYLVTKTFQLLIPAVVGTIIFIAPLFFKSGLRLLTIIVLPFMWGFTILVITQQFFGLIDAGSNPLVIPFYMILFYILELIILFLYKYKTTMISLLILLVLLSLISYDIMNYYMRIGSLEKEKTRREVLQRERQLEREERDRMRGDERSTRYLDALKRSRDTWLVSCRTSDDCPQNQICFQFSGPMENWRCVPRPEILIPHGL